MPKVRDILREDGVRDAPSRQTALARRVDDLEDRVSLLEESLTLLRDKASSVEARADDLERAVVAAPSLSRTISDGSYLILQYLEGEKTVRFSDLFLYPLSKGIVKQDSVSPDRAYAALHARLTHMHRRGLVRRSAWGRWAVTEAGRSVQVRTGPETSGELYDGSIDAFGVPPPAAPEPGPPGDEESYEVFNRTGKAPRPPD